MKKCDVFRGWGRVKAYSDPSYIIFSGSIDNRNSDIYVPEMDRGEHQYCYEKAHDRERLRSFVFRLGSIIRP